MPQMTSTFIQPGTGANPSTNLSWNQTRMTAELNGSGTGMFQAGITSCILQWSADLDAGTAYYPSTSITNGTNLAGMLLTAAATTTPAMKIWFGLGTTTYYNFYYNCVHPTTGYVSGTLLTKQLTTASELYALYGSSIAGWYLPCELDGNYAPGSTQQITAASYYSSLISQLHTTYPSIPTLSSPFYAGLQLTPAQYATLVTEVWGGTGLSILAVQTGAGDASIGAYSMTPAQIASYFAAISGALSGTGTALWANCDMYNGSGTPLDIATLVSSMRAAEGYVTGYTGFSFTSQMSPTGLGSSTVYNNYLSYLPASGHGGGLALI